MIKLRFVTKDNKKILQYLPSETSRWVDVPHAEETLRSKLETKLIGINEHSKKVDLILANPATKLQLEHEFNSSQKSILGITQTIVCGISIKESKEIAPGEFKFYKEVTND